MRDDSATFRADIEGLRAVAVLAVLAYHADLGPFRGGYVGVDVFFVVSGFLITSRLATELASDGRRALPQFWARRARRLLPAGAVVVVATTVASWWMLDPLAQRDLGHDTIAAGLFVANIVFARREGDYLAAQLAPSPLLHYWSLALEEQFYVAWPLILLTAVRLRSRWRHAVAAAVGIGWVTSLTLCIWMTRHHQPFAFYQLPTRAWELLTGAAVALLAPRLRALPRHARAVGGWAGVLAIACSIVRFGPDTDFPGAAALLPVSAAAMVITAGLTSSTWGADRLLRTSPLVWIGRRSYGIYLWHWPLLVLTAARFGPLAAWPRVALMLAAVGLASASLVLVENPVRHLGWLVSSARRSLLVGAAVAVLVLGVAVVQLVRPAQLGSDVVAAPAALIVPGPPARPTPATTTTTGAGSPVSSDTIHAGPVATVVSAAASTSVPAHVAATAPTSITTGVPASVPVPVAISFDAVTAIAAANAALLDASAATRDVPANLRPALSRAHGDTPLIYADGCMLSDGSSEPGQCVFGDPSGTTTIGLFGDSHAAQWFPALELVASEHHWRLLALTKKGCPTADVRIAKRNLDAECGRWRQHVADRLSSEHPALLVLSSYRYRLAGNDGAAADQAWSDGLTRTMALLRPSADRVLILGDTPTPAVDVPGCVAAHAHSADRCTRARTDAIKSSRLEVERAVAAADDASFVPTGDWLCGATRCPVIIGDVLVYRDDNHMTADGSALLAPYIDAALTAMLG